MIRALLAALALTACAPRQTSCDVSFDRQIAFTAANAQDVVTARSFGPACDKTVALYTVSTADGHPIWAWTAPVARAFGAALRPENPEAMRAFLERWSQPKLETTGAAPPWPLPDYASTTLDQLTYDDLRARNLPMLCHLSGTALESCVFWEPGAASAGHFIDRAVRADEQGAQHDPDQRSGVSDGRDSGMRAAGGGNDDANHEHGEH